MIQMAIRICVESFSRAPPGRILRHPVLPPLAPMLRPSPGSHAPPFGLRMVTRGYRYMGPPGPFRSMKFRKANAVFIKFRRAHAFDKRPEPMAFY